jgi:hypothetical protein
MFKVSGTAGNILKTQSDSNVSWYAPRFRGKSCIFLPRTFFGQGFSDQQLVSSRIKKSQNILRHREEAARAQWALDSPGLGFRV